MTHDPMACPGVSVQSQDRPAGWDSTPNTLNGEREEEERIRKTRE